jgi:hypothetical protein
VRGDVYSLQGILCGQMPCIAMIVRYILCRKYKLRKYWPDTPFFLSPVWREEVRSGHCSHCSHCWSAGTAFTAVIAVTDVTAVTAVTAAVTAGQNQTVVPSK